MTESRLPLTVGMLRGDAAADTPGKCGVAGDGGFEREAGAGLSQPGARGHGSADVLLEEYAFLAGAGIDSATLLEACLEARRMGVLPHWRLIVNGRLSAQRYLTLLEMHLIGSVREGAGLRTEVVDGIAGLPSEIAQAVAEVRARGNAPLLLSRQQIDWSEAAHSRRLRVEMAANGLKRRHPEMSAGSPFATWQVVAAPVLVGTAAGAFIVVPDVAPVLLALGLVLPFVAVVGLRLLAFLVALRLPAPGAPAIARVADAELPVYSVMVPMFREAEVLPDLVGALAALDYPAEKLDILLVLESVDRETLEAARRLALPAHMRVVVVPDLQPRTKPKALNYALRLSRGDYVVIYDAEDDPDPDQLRRAVAQFQRGGSDLMCVQARLAMDNRRPGLIARQFMLEYAALFDAMLPALERLGLPILLGGTSNHFPRQVLEALWGWDAWNVTEDADLGIRIARRGGRVEVLDSTTYEEAPERLSIWLKQRTRWIKGFMQTWLVHMRRPRELRRELGFAGFWGINAYLGGILLSALILPLFLGSLVLGAVTGSLWLLPDTTLGSVVMGLALFNLVAGYGCGIAMAALAASRRRQPGLMRHVVLMPLYWVLISAAAYRALVQLVTKPYLWEKTPHVSRARRGGGR